MSFTRNYVGNLINVIRHAIHAIAQASELLVPGYLDSKDTRLAFIMDQLADALESLDQAWQQSVGLAGEVSERQSLSPQVTVPNNDNWETIATSKPYLQLLVKESKQLEQKYDHQNEQDDTDDAS